MSKNLLLLLIKLKFSALSNIPEKNQYRYVTPIIQSLEKSINSTQTRQLLYAPIFCWSIEIWSHWSIDTNINKACPVLGVLKF